MSRFISILYPMSQLTQKLIPFLYLAEHYCHRTFTLSILIFFFFNDTAPTEISPLPLHDALPIFAVNILLDLLHVRLPVDFGACRSRQLVDRKSTRLNSSHRPISYAVFFLQK